MFVTCEKCGRKFRFRQTRGNRLKDFRCECGGEFYSSNKGKTSKLEGRKQEQCKLCGKKGYVGDGGRLKEYSSAVLPMFHGHDDRTEDGHIISHIAPYLPGFYCWWHEMKDVRPEKHRFEQQINYVSWPEELETCQFCHQSKSLHVV